MKAKLLFDLELKEDQLAHLRALNATNCYIAFHQIMEDVFRKRIKYANDDTSEEQITLLYELRDEINSIMESLDINLNHLE